MILLPASIGLAALLVSALAALGARARERRRAEVATPRFGWRPERIQEPIRFTFAGTQERRGFAWAEEKASAPRPLPSPAESFDWGSVDRSGFHWRDGTRAPLSRQ